MPVSAHVNRYEACVPSKETSSKVKSMLPPSLLYFTALLRMFMSNRCRWDTLVSTHGCSTETDFVVTEMSRTAA